MRKKSNVPGTLGTPGTHRHPRGRRGRHKWKELLDQVELGQQEHAAEGGVLSPAS